MQTNFEPVKKDTIMGQSGIDADLNRNFIEPGMTLTDITEFLLKEDMMLQRTITKSNEAFSSLQV